eukprot:3593428-Prorocentrum_lima.AAC.1
MSCIFEKEVKQHIRCAFGAHCIIFTANTLSIVSCALRFLRMVLLDEVDHRRRCRATAMPRISAG